MTRVFRTRGYTGNTPASPSGPISTYEMDGDLVDDGVAVNGALVGTWTDTAEDPLLADGGTSLFKTGGQYGTLPNIAPAHNFGAMTISVYYQPNSALNKHTLLAGSGEFSGVAGDFSLERLTNGRLRAFHYDQAGDLGFFESSAGIAATNLATDTAYRIDLSLGPAGAALYLDGALVSSLPTHTNAWNNARVKYLGIWVDGVQSSVDGAFDKLRIWDRQLTQTEITALEAATSVTLGTPAVGGTEPQMPSLAEWLTNDDVAVPGGATLVTEGNLQASLNAASPGDTLSCNVGAGITFWDFTDGLDCPSGTAGNPITLMAPIGSGVVISRSEAYSAFRTPGAGNWTQSGLSQSDIDKKIWRSVSSSFGSAASLMGFWIEFDHPHQMVRCSSLSNLQGAYTNGVSPTAYSGPQARVHTDGRVYIRMQKPHPTKYSTDDKWSGREWNDPQAYNNGVINYPVSENPNDYVIHLFKAEFTSFPSNTIGFDVGASGGYFKIGEGINSLGHGRVAQGSNITIRRGTHLVWRYGLVYAGSGQPVQEEWDVQRARFSDGSKIHLSRTHWKNVGFLVDVRSGFLFCQAALGLRGFYFKDVTIADFHELLIDGDREFRWRNCSFLHGMDDGIQAHQTLSRVEIGYCYFRGNAYGGQGKGGAEAPDPNPGGWLIHHNVVDNRECRVTNENAQPHPHYLYLSHSPDGNQPRKYYNNLFMQGPDLEETTSIGLSSNYDRDMTTTTALTAQEVFNNIHVIQDSQRYDSTTGYSDNVHSPDSHFARYINCDPDRSNEVFDYNLYWRDVPGSTALPKNGWGLTIREGRGVNEQNFATLALFQASALFTTSKASGSKRGAYAPGFEASSTEAEPPMPSVTNFPADRFDYRPSATSPITTSTTISLSGADWWSTPPSWGGDYFDWNDGALTLAPSAWKGALDPNGSTMPVGVQNP